MSEQEFGGVGVGDGGGGCIEGWGGVEIAAA